MLYLIEYRNIDFFVLFVILLLQKKKEKRSKVGRN